MKMILVPYVCITKTGLRQRDRRTERFKQGAIYCWQGSAAVDVGGLTDDGGIHPIRLAAVLFHSNPRNRNPIQRFISMSSSFFG
jgi:hypothetical protein